MLDGLGVGMGVGEFVAGAFEVGTGFFDIRLELLEYAMQALVVIKVLVLNLRVLLPGVGRGALMDIEEILANGVLYSCDDSLLQRLGVAIFLHGIDSKKRHKDKTIS